MQTTPRWIRIALVVALFVLFALAASLAAPRERNVSYSIAEGALRRQKLERLLASIRAHTLPDAEQMALVPLDPHHWTDPSRAAWKAYLASAQPWLSEFDALHDDAELVSLLAESDGKPPTVPPHLGECMWWESVLRARAVIAIDEGHGEESVRRLAQLLDIALLYRDAEAFDRAASQAFAIGTFERVLTDCVVQSDWNAEFAWREMQPRIDALIADTAEFAAPFHAGRRALEARYWAIVQGEFNVTLGQVKANEMLEDSVRGCIRRLGICKLLLAAERMRQRTGAWPTSVADLAGLIEPSDARESVDGRPFELRADSEGLTVWYPTIAGETPSHSTPSLTLKR